MIVRKNLKTLNLLKEKLAQNLWSTGIVVKKATLKKTVK